MTDMEEFDVAAPAAGEWVNELQRHLGWLHRDRTYAALIATLHERYVTASLRMRRFFLAIT